MWIRRKVKRGTGTGRKIGYPTLNFNVGDFDEYHDKGIYITEVKIGNKTYKGGLYYGPRLSSGEDVLEIYVIGLNKNLYDQLVTFRVLKKIRKPKTFKSLEELKKQITDDLKQV